MTVHASFTSDLITVTHYTIGPSLPTFHINRSANTQNFLARAFIKTDHFCFYISTSANN